MAREYAKVLKAKEKNFKVIGRSEKTALTFKENFPDVEVVTGGLESYLKTTREIPSFAIIATNVISLYENTLSLLDHGVSHILVEKPGFLSKEEGEKLLEKSSKTDAKVWIAYNRRYFSSVRQAKKLITQEGGVSSFHFEFTEWGHEIETLSKNPKELEAWFLSNSSHVVDLAFFLGGKPREISSYHSGSLIWHSKAARYTGAGRSENGAPFSYFADWDAPGRWSVEVLSSKNRYIFKPIEKLQVQTKGSVAIHFIDADYSNWDEEFKPGLYLMVEDFLEKEKGDLCSLKKQVEMFSFYEQMSKYGGV